MSWQKISSGRRRKRSRLLPSAGRRQASGVMAVPPAVVVTLLAGGFAAVFIAERRHPLRKRVEQQLPHVGRDVAMLALSALATTILQKPLLAPVARQVQERQLGLLNSIRIPCAIRVILGVLVLDYTLWWWHWANHRVPLLWRFHLPHHVDLDLDSATALRFHFGEMSLSVFFRMAQIRALGPDALSVSIWQVMLMLSIVFHHSNLRLGDAAERTLRKLIVTPAMHGIHHSDFQNETDSNWSSLFSIWDYLHGTARFDVPQSAITIGVPAWENPCDVTLGHVIAMPFGKMRQDWLAGDGTVRRSRDTFDVSNPDDSLHRHNATPLNLLPSEET
ncbi:MAG: sterol desaturase family protein [Acidobacteriota bacterium]